jgi:hypothetical protein
MITFYNIGEYGRFGNQLFQYAMLFGLSKQNGYDFRIPNSPKCTLGDVFDGIRFGEPQNIIRRVGEPNGAATIYLEDIGNIPDGTDFVGYFQSPKYFEHCRDALREHLVIKQNYLDTVTPFLKTHKDLGFIHVRRGDYTKVSHCHPPITVEYIKEAIEISKAKKFVVVSDDLRWCKENLSFLDPLYSPFYEMDIGNDFALMTQCSSAIIANSSFSWWAAWLGKEKDVVAPSKWFGSDPSVPQKWSDIYCEGWRVI